jgi:hypothetical protein
MRLHTRIHRGLAGLALLALCGPAHAGGYALAGNHNGSGVDILENRIVYATPKASLRDVVRPGSTLVEGRWAGDRFRGHAYAFKTGCAPARYAVIGRRNDDGSMVFTGPGPVRAQGGCDVVGYDPRSPHARLVVDGIWSP